MPAYVELECIYSRVSRSLGCNGFLGFIIGNTRDVFKILLTCRAERPGGRLWEATVIVDKYLEFAPNKLYCISGCYTICTLRGQEKIFIELKKYIPVDKYSVGKNEKAWLIYNVEEYRMLDEKYLRNPDRIILNCPSADLSYVIGWKNYILAHSDVSDISNRIKNIMLRIKDKGI